MALGLARAGANVMITAARTQHELDAVKHAAANEQAGAIHTILADAASEEDSLRVVDRTIRAFGQRPTTRSGAWRGERFALDQQCHACNRSTRRSWNESTALDDNRRPYSSRCGTANLVYAASPPEPQETGAAEAEPPAEPSSVEPPAPAIPPGTTITKSNWRQYQQFFTQGEIGFWEGKWFWKMPDDAQINGEWVQVEEPEQARYTADLVLLWQDNLRPEGHWAFLPALRRSIPLTDNSHCEALLSSRALSYGYADSSRPGRVNDLQGDYDTAPGWFEPVAGAVPDAVMNNYAGGVQTTSPQNLSIMHGGWIGGIGDYDVTSVKRQQLLALTQLNFEYGRFPDNYDMPLGWAKPSWGAWELRKVWVIEVRPIPLLANQCKGKRLIYVDRSLSAPLAEDLYDGNMNLSKVMVISLQPKSEAEYGMQTWAGGGILQLWDVAGEHAFMSMTADSRGRT